MILVDHHSSCSQIQLNYHHCPQCTFNATNAKSILQITACLLLLLFANFRWLFVIICEENLQFANWFLSKETIFFLRRLTSKRQIYKLTFLTQSKVSIRKAWYRSELANKSAKRSDLLFGLADKWSIAQHKAYLKDRKCRVFLIFNSFRSEIFASWARAWKIPDWPSKRAQLKRPLEWQIPRDKHNNWDNMAG